MESFLTEAMYSSSKIFMTLEESHFHATKRPDRVFVDARYLWVEGLMTIEKYHFQAAKTPNRGSINGRGSYAQRRIHLQ